MIEGLAEEYLASRGIERSSHIRAHDMWATWKICQDVYPEKADDAKANLDAWVAIHVNKSELVRCIRNLLENRTPAMEERARSLIRKLEKR